MTTRNLRDRIVDALHTTYPADYHHPDADHCEPCQTRAAAALTIVQPELDALENIRDEQADRIDHLHAMVSARDELLVKRGDQCAAAGRERDEALAVLARVRDAHQRPAYADGGPAPYCACGVAWPCPTLRALAAPDSPEQP